MVHVHTKFVFFPPKKSVSIGKEGVNYIIIFTEKMKYNVSVNKTYKYNVVGIAGIPSMAIWISCNVAKFI